MACKYLRTKFKKIPQTRYCAKQMSKYPLGQILIMLPVQHRAIHVNSSSTSILYPTILNWFDYKKHMRKDMP